MSTGRAQHASSSGRANDHGDLRRTSLSGGNTLQGRHNRSRASNFRKISHFKRIVELVDVDGIRRRVVDRGQKNITRHETVLQVLTNRAQRFRRKMNVVGSEVSTHDWTVDETGTINTSVIISELETEQQEISEMNNITLPEEILQVHGYAPPKKAEGTVRLIYENVNGLQNRLSGNEKVERAREIHD